MQYILPVALTLMQLHRLLFAVTDLTQFMSGYAFALAPFIPVQLAMLLTTGNG